jgi:hypothetical protein
MVDPKPNREASESSEPKERFLPRWVFLLAIPGFLGPVLILAFIFRSELAHDEARCPYAEVSAQTLPGDIRVREERRSCVQDVEERRYSSIRGGEARVLGRRRLPTEAFEGPKYAWKAGLTEKGEVRVVVNCPGHPEAVFREGKPEEFAQ